METLAGICILCNQRQTIEKTRVLQCGHLFHDECIDGWFENRNFCPICRAKDDTAFQIFRPSSVTKDAKSEKSKLSNSSSNESMEPFFAYKTYEELKNEIMDKIQSLWKPDEIAQMNAGRVFAAAGKSHLMCKNAIKQKKFFDAYYFALRTGYLLKEMEKTSDISLYYRNHEYEFKELSAENFNTFHTFESHLIPTFEHRIFAKDQIAEILEAFQSSLSSNGKEHQISFFTSLPNSINL
uniref:RING-type domain-containing protein n=1 Tax=Panagrolaimus sp. ES5 TaxID=591445 RepID=A0AC34GPU6_9BILA